MADRRDIRKQVHMFVQVSRPRRNRRPQVCPILETYQSRQVSGQEIRAHPLSQNFCAPLRGAGKGDKE